MNRADRRALARKGEPHVQQDDQPAAALIEETYATQTVNVIAHEAAAGQPAHIDIRQLIAPVAPGVFMYAKVVQLPPQLAIQLGEHIAAEGRRVKTSVEIAAPGSVPNLRG